MQKSRYMTLETREPSEQYFDPIAKHQAFVSTNARPLNKIGSVLAEHRQRKIERAREIIAIAFDLNHAARLTCLDIARQRTQDTRHAYVRESLRATCRLSDIRQAVVPFNPGIYLGQFLLATEE